MCSKGFFVVTTERVPLKVNPSCVKIEVSHDAYKINLVKVKRRVCELETAHFLLYGLTSKVNWAYYQLTKKKNIIVA